MLFLVISEPRPEPPSSVTAADLIPARFEVHGLIDPASAQRFLHQVPPPGGGPS